MLIKSTELESMIYMHDGNSKETELWRYGLDEVYSAGKMVTYMVDSGVSYQEKVKKGQSCLAPTTFTPSKSGWAFVGWREDAAASGSVLGSKLMERSPITLYAVFKQVITLSYNGNGATGGSTAAQTGDRYYNNENIANPEFTLRSNGFSRTSASFINWALNSTSGDRYNAGASITLSASATLYAKWNVTVTTEETASYIIPGGKYYVQSGSNANVILAPSSMSGGGTILSLSGGKPQLEKTVTNLTITLSARMRIPGYEGGDEEVFTVALYNNGTKIKDINTYTISGPNATFDLGCNATNLNSGSFYIQMNHSKGCGARFEDQKTMSVTVKATSTHEE